MRRFLAHFVTVIPQKLWHVQPIATTHYKDKLIYCGLGYKTKFFFSPSPCTSRLFSAKWSILRFLAHFVTVIPQKLWHVEPIAPTHDKDKLVYCGLGYKMKLFFSPSPCMSRLFSSKWLIVRFSAHFLTIIPIQLWHVEPFATIHYKLGLCTVV